MICHPLRSAEIAPGLPGCRPRSGTIPRSPVRHPSARRHRNIPRPPRSSRLRGWLNGKPLEAVQKPTRKIQKVLEIERKCERNSDWMSCGWVKMCVLNVFLGNITSKIAILQPLKRCLVWHFLICAPFCSYTWESRGNLLPWQPFPKRWRLSKSATPNFGWPHRLTLLSRRCSAAPQLRSWPSARSSAKPRLLWHPDGRPWVVASGKHTKSYWKWP